MDVIKKLRIQIILVVMGIQTILLSSIFFLSMGLISTKEMTKFQDLLEIVVENGGRFPTKAAAFSKLKDSGRQHKKKSIFSIEVKFDEDSKRAFSVKMTPNGEIEEVLSDFSLNYSKEEITAFVNEIVKHASKGYNFSNWKTPQKLKGDVDDVVYCILYQPDGSKVISLMDLRGEMASIRGMIHFVFYLFLFSLILSFLGVFFLSSYIISPVKNAFIKQRQFVADAGHELKTPIAVIGANLDVLMPDMPDNRWLNYIKNENERMGQLVKNLLYLARNDADRIEDHVLVFDFSAAIKNAVLPFESVAFEAVKHLELDIDDGIFFTGDEFQIKQVAAILVDNAIKNSDVDALIRVSARCEKERIIFKVFNTGHGIKKEDLEKIFLRFYRSDASRARKTGGYGLGLAIARTIAERHGGTLTADSDYGNWAEFTFILPLRVSNKHSLLRIFERIKNH